MSARLCSLLGLAFGLFAAESPSFAQPSRTFGADSKRTGVFTGAGTTPPGLTCSPPSPPSPFTKCFGLLASAVDGALLDVTVTVPPGPGPNPLVVYVHGYGGSKNTSSSYDDALAARGYTVLRHSTRGFGESWGQVNLSDVDVELEDLRSLVGQVVDDPRLHANGDAVAVAGASYGGGHSWLAAVKPTFTSPRGQRIRIRTVVPIAAWSDLLAALRPNGRAYDSVEPPGFFKLSFFEALFLGGIRRSPSRPYPNYPDYLWLWNGYVLATEPNNAPPVGSGIVNGIAGYRSIWWQQPFWAAVAARKGTADQLPIFIVQGFTDDLFPLTEALRMYQTLRSIDENYPIAAYFGDIGHPRAANKPDEVAYVLERVFEWLDFYLLGKGAAASPTICPGPAPQLRCDVLAAITRLGAPFKPVTDVVQAKNYASLSSGVGRADLLPAEAVLTFNPANVAGLFVDPFVFSGCDALGAGLACAAPPPAVVPGDVALYEMPASVLSASAGLARGPFLIAGQPLVTLSATTGAPRVELNARLYDVKPDGTRQLITRGTFTLDSGVRTLPIGSADVSLTTYGNLWEVGADDLVQLELTNVDSPYLTPSRVPSVTVIRNVKVAAPVR